MKETLYEILISAAKSGTILHYYEVLRMLSIRTGKEGMVILTGLLTEITEDEIQAGRPPVSCLVTRFDDKLPGFKFFILYSKLTGTQCDYSSTKAKMKLFDEMKNEVFEFWSDQVVVQN
jgi:hypothetical protein